MSKPRKIVPANLPSKQFLQRSGIQDGQHLFQIIDQNFGERDGMASSSSHQRLKSSHQQDLQSLYAEELNVQQQIFYYNNKVLNNVVNKLRPKSSKHENAFVRDDSFSDVLSQPSAFQARGTSPFRGSKVACKQDLAQVTFKSQTQKARRQVQNFQEKGGLIQTQFWDVDDGKELDVQGSTEALALALSQEHRKMSNTASSQAIGMTSYHPKIPIVLRKAGCSSKQLRRPLPVKVMNKHTKLHNNTEKCDDLVNGDVSESQTFAEENKSSQYI